LFKKDLVIQGYQGGRLAAQIVTQTIAEYLANEDIHVFGRLSFWINIYFNKSALKEFFFEAHHCTPDQFDDFITVRVLILFRFSSVSIIMSACDRVSRTLPPDSLLSMVVIARMPQRLKSEVSASCMLI